jgi:hypothetical protein
MNLRGSIVQQLYYHLLNTNAEMDLFGAFEAFVVA